MSDLPALREVVEVYAVCATHGTTICADAFPADSTYWCLGCRFNAVRAALPALLDEVERLRTVLAKGLDEEMKTVHICRWQEDPWDGSWDTACGQKFVFTTDGPVENGMRFCPYCRGRLKAGKAGQP